MSDKEKEMAQKIAELPDRLQDKFLEGITWAAMTLDAMQKDEADNGEE